MNNLGSRIRKYATSPAAFREALLIDTDSGPQPFGSVTDEWQERDFRAMDSAWLRMAGRGGDPQRQRAYLERPRGHSKTSDLAISVLWALAFSSRQLSGVAAAADRGQARLLRNGIDRLVRVNPWLAQTIDIQNYRIVNTKTRSELEILSSDAPASYGRTPDFVCVDELTHWSSRDLWDSLISASAKRGHCVVVVISNAGYSDSWQRDAYDAIRDTDTWHFSRLDGPQASWIDPSRLEEQRRLLPDPAYRRLWLNEWSSGSGDALSGEDIEAAVTLPGPCGWERGWTYVGGLDLGVSRDHSALAVVGRHIGYSQRIEREERPQTGLSATLVDLGLAPAPRREPEEDYIEHRGTHRLKLAHLQSWRPPKRGKVDLQAVEDAVLAAHDRYGLGAVLYDPHQAEHMAQRLRRRGVRMVDIPFIGNNLQSLASTLIEAFTSKHVDLFFDELLLSELKKLRILEKSYGFRLDSPKGKDGHGDRATAFALALLGCKRHVHVHSILHRPLLHEGVALDIDEFEPEDINPFEGRLGL